VDRFCWNGYRGHLDTRRQFRIAGKIKGLRGLIIQCQNVINRRNCQELIKLSRDTGVEIAAVDANIFQKEFKWGGLSNADPKLRRKAMDIVRETIDMAAETGCNNAGLWLGQDGFDYPFQEDALSGFNRIRDAVAELADYDPRVRLCIEYKVSEPRVYLYVNNVGKAMALIYEIGKDNVGITCDIGHIYMNKENPAEAAMYAAQRGRLFSMHFNDGRGCFDDDLIAGSVHIWDAIELLYYLEQAGYDGWYGLDIFPYREDLPRTVEMCIRNIHDLRRIALKIDPKTLRRKQARGDAIESQKYLRDLLFGNVG
jgi:xylose isomerase